MSIKKLSLSSVQFNKLAEVEQELAFIKVEQEKLAKKQTGILELILDHNGIVDTPVKVQSFDPATKELTIEIPE